MRCTMPAAAVARPWRRLTIAALCVAPGSSIWRHGCLCLLVPEVSGVDGGDGGRLLECPEPKHGEARARVISRASRCWATPSSESGPVGGSHGVEGLADV